MTPSGARVQLDDREARRRIHDSLGESLLVEASAGTGKTTELVARLVSVLRCGAATIDRVVAVTFTHKASGELKIRLRQELDRARRTVTDPAERHNLEDALERLEASIGTIHAFCAQILRERPVEAVVDPDFEELTEQQSSVIYARAFRSWFEQKLGESSPALRRALARLAWGDTWNNGTAVEQLQYAGRELTKWRDFPTPWRRPAFERLRLIDDLVRYVSDLADLSEKARRPNDALRTSLRPAREFKRWIQRAKEAGSRDYDIVEALLIKFLRDLKKNLKNGSGIFSDQLSREQVLLCRDNMIAALTAFKDDADADLAASLRDEMWDLVEKYDAMKRRAGKLDFVDLLICARDLVRDNAEVRRYFQERFTHIFVDEFQDTDPLQAELLLLLCADDPAETDWLAATPKSGKLFAVGDPKQSIYKFRRADVVLYQQIKQGLAERGVGIVHLTTSHRALEPIQECVNASFAPEIVEDIAAGQAQYSPLAGGAAAITDQPHVIALPAPRPYGSARKSLKAIEACLPDAVAAFTSWLLNESGWRVRDAENDGQLTPISPRHICVLFRRFTNYGADLTREYVKALEAREIQHLLVGSKSFHAREEVQAMRAALAAIEWPDDELSVYATLRGSLFAISDEALLAFKHMNGRLHPFRPSASTGETACDTRKALDVLADLHRERNRRPIAATINALLDATRAHAGFALRPAGHQVLANVNRIRDLARSFETEGGISFRGFVESLEADAARLESTEAPVLEEGAEGVRLMTVHAAKGLEFPVVILADMTAKIAPGEPDRYIDAKSRLCAIRLLGCTPWELRDHRQEEERREHAEGLRVAYVAATRARDLLVVPAMGDEAIDGWVSPLNKAIYPAPPQSRKSRPAPGCPQFGEASVLERPFMINDEPSVKPGLHKPQTGAHDVVWWDPQVLRLNVDVNIGLKQQQILSPTGEGPSESLAHYKIWRVRRGEAIGRGARKQFDVFTPSETTEAPAGFDLLVRFEHVDRAPERPGGVRFGSLVHAILRETAFDATPAVIRSLAKSQGRLLGAPDDEIGAAADAVISALRHPVFARAAAAERRHREFPILFHAASDKVLEGVIDLAFLENGVWHVVDFKTDAHIGGQREHYENQLRWYAYALGRLTSAKVEAYLIAI